MTEFCELLKKLATSINPFTVILVVFCTITALFLVSLFLCLFRVGYGKKKRAWFYLSCMSLIFFELCFCCLNRGYSGVFFNLGVAVILSLPIIFIPEKKKEISKEQLTLARFLAGQELKAKSEGQSFSMPVERPRSVVKLKTEEESEPVREEDFKSCEVDFSHVKSIIERLEFFNLTPNDKRQIKELEINVSQAENGEYNESLKDKINSGLGALLKIMSKYGA